MSADDQTHTREWNTIKDDAEMRVEEGGEKSAENVGVPWSSNAPDDEYAADSCQNCGAPVSLRFRRVFGDNDDVAHACKECETGTDYKNGAAAGLEPVSVGGNGVVGSAIGYGGDE